MNHKCLYCGTHTTITNPNYYADWSKVNISKSPLGEVGIRIKCITCPNKECQKLHLTTELTGARLKPYTTVWEPTKVIQTWRLLPESEARVLPDYVPLPIKEDYIEACRIRDLSPKASATLSRRCLQGMIRDFHGISRKRLIDEILELEGVLEKDVWESIEAVRKIGNIGAHMESDINVIVDVDSSEAQLLISLVEQLVDEWYVNRENRRVRTEDLKKMVRSKEAVKTK